MKFKLFSCFVACGVIIGLSCISINAPIAKEEQKISKIISVAYQQTTYNPATVAMVEKEVAAHLPQAIDENAFKGVKIIATAYCSCSKCCGKSDGNTASGKIAEWWTIAVPKDIPFGSTIYLDGWGTFTAWDRGGAIKRVDDDTIKIDIWFPTHQEALNFGKQEFYTTINYPEEETINE